MSYDFEVVGELAKDFECPICLSLIKEANELPCTHVFCKRCIENWQHNPMERNKDPLCPSCKQGYAKDTVTANKYLDKLIKTSLQVKCKGSRIGCEWIGTVLDYPDHEEKCLYKNVNCQFEGCTEMFPKLFAVEHEPQCVYRQEQCQYCKQTLQFLFLERHYEDCTEYIIDCINKECSVRKPRRQIPDHVQYECLYQIVACKYEPFGCKEKFQRHYRYGHFTENLADHMNLLFIHASNSSMESSKMKNKLEIIEELAQKSISSLQQNEEMSLKTTENLLQKAEEISKLRCRLQKAEKNVQKCEAKHQENVRELANTKQTIVKMKKEIKEMGLNTAQSIDKMEKEMEEMGLNTTQSIDKMEKEMEEMKREIRQIRHTGKLMLVSLIILAVISILGFICLRQ